MPTLTPRERIGTIIGGRYAIKRLIGEGGFSAVFEAVHEITGAHVALKILHPHLVTTEQIAERFLMEARAMARIRHDGIVRVLDANKEPDGTIFIALELLEGEPLETTLSRAGRLTWDETVTIGADVLGALSEAHRAGIIHRDIKPGNIFVTRGNDGSCQAKLLDFGIAQVAQPSGGKLTQQGMILGTPEYMSPEQSRSGAIGPESDLWSVGIVLFECLTGVTPFMSESTTEILLKVASTDAPSVLEFDPEVPRAIAAVIDGALVREVASRHRSAEAMRDALLQARAVADAERFNPPATPPEGVRRAPPDTLGASVAPLPVIRGGAFSEGAVGRDGRDGREVGTVPPAPVREVREAREVREVREAREVREGVREVVPALGRSGGPPKRPSPPSVPAATSTSSPAVPALSLPVPQRESPARDALPRADAARDSSPGLPPPAREPGGRDSSPGLSPLRGPTPAPINARDSSPGVSPLRGPTPAPINAREPAAGGRSSAARAADEASELDIVRERESGPSRSPDGERLSASGVRVRERDTPANRSDAYPAVAQELPAFQAPPPATVRPGLLVAAVVTLAAIGGIALVVFRGESTGPAARPEPPPVIPPDDPDPVAEDASAPPAVDAVRLVERRAVPLPAGFTGVDSAAEFARHAAVSTGLGAGASQRVLTTCIPAGEGGAWVYLYPLAGGAALGSSRGVVACSGFDLGVVPDLTRDGTDDVVAVAPGGRAVVFLNSGTMQSFRTVPVVGARGVMTGLAVNNEPVALVYAEPGGAGAPTAVSAVSLVTTSTLWTVRGSGALARAGEPVEVGLAVGPDVTGDGVADVAIGSVPVIGAALGTLPARARCVQMYSGAGGEPVWREPFCQARGGGSQSVSVGPDVDGDGKGDVVVGTDHPTGDDAPVVLLSGATGRLLRSLSLNVGEAASGFGWPVALGGDVDGNGTPDVAVGSVGSGTYVTLFDATTGRQVSQLRLGGVGAGNLRVFLVPSSVPSAPWSVVTGNPAGGLRVYARATGDER